MPEKMFLCKNFGKTLRKLTLENSFFFFKILENYAKFLPQVFVKLATKSGSNKLFLIHYN